MTYKVIINSKNGKFPVKGLNELLAGRFYNPRTKRYHNPVKEENDRVCRSAIKKYLKGVKIDKPIQCTYLVYVKDKKHDRGNVYASVEKSFLDALQECKVIKNDGYDDVLDGIFKTDIDKESPRIEVMIEEMEI